MPDRPGEAETRRRQLRSGNRLALLIVAALLCVQAVMTVLPTQRAATWEIPLFSFDGTFSSGGEEPATRATSTVLADAAPLERTPDPRTRRAAGAERNTAMNDVTGYVSSLFLSVAIALVVALVLRRPLGELLVELCGNERRARFWAAFASIALVLGAMLGTLLSIPAVGEPAWDAVGGLRGLLVGLRSGTFLLLAVIATMGFVMLVGISRAPVPRALDEGRG